MGQDKLLALLLGANAQVNKAMDNGFTALIMAA